MAGARASRGTTPSGASIMESTSTPPRAMKAKSPCSLSFWESATRATVPMAVAVRLFRPATATQMTGRMLLCTPKTAGVMKLPQET